MDCFDRLLQATQDDYEGCILQNTLLQKLHSGEVTHAHYAAYLSQLFHFVRHTSRALALAAARVEDDRRELRAWLLEQALDEHGHELLCLRDLEHLGCDARQATQRGPGPGVWGLVTQNYYIASFGKAAAFLGVASATEGMGAELAGGMAQVLERRYGVPHDALSFLRSHSGFDRQHYAQARAAIRSAGEREDDFAAIVWARRMTFRYYGQMLFEVQELATAAAPASRMIAA